MTRSAITWYTLAALLVLGPVGIRIYSWPRTQPKIIDVADAEEGRTLFTHEWTVNDPLSGGDGLGPVFNANSCVACHNQGGVGGGGGLEHNVTNFFGGTGTARSGLIHANATSPEYQETLANIDPNLPPISQVKLETILPANINIEGGKNVARLSVPAGVRISQRNTPALFGARLIDELPDSAIIAQERMQKLRFAGADNENSPLGRALRLSDGRIGKFGWKAQSASLIDFVEAACANELGLSNPGQAQPTPLAMANYRSTGTDLTTKQCQQMAAFIAALPQPTQNKPDNARDADRVKNGEHAFRSIGCADCHVPDIGSSIKGIYSDLLMHKMGLDLVGVGGGYYAPPTQPNNPDGSAPDEWRTPPLWGVADSAPYLHDGRAATLEQAIALHGGQAGPSSQRFSKLVNRDQNDLVFFLKSLRAPH